MEEERRAAPEGGARILNRDVIKYIAMVTMFLNHFAHMFLQAGTAAYEVLLDIGIFTAPVMCYFLVEGYMHTRSKVKYGLRLFLFALLSQLPFQLALGYKMLNMIFTLLCCFLILVVMEKVSSPMLKAVLCVLLVLMTMVADWAVVAPLTTILLCNAWGDRKRMAHGFLVVYLLFSMLNVPSYTSGETGGWTAYAVFQGLLSGLGILAAAVTVLALYNGERAKRGRNFSKWFFYIFYPAHLLVLYLIKISLHNTDFFLLFFNVK